MPLITFSEVDSALNRSYGKRMATKSASSILVEETQRFRLNHRFNIFLSHSYNDAQLHRDRLLGTKALLEQFGYSVYVDWIIDQQLNREKVNPNTARILRMRMSHSRCLLFATSKNSHNSRWMPWELGFKDGNTGSSGKLGAVAILPLVQDAGTYSFRGQEYLSLIHI